MICTRCLTRLSRRAPPSSSTTTTAAAFTRTLTTTPSRAYSTPTTSETSTTTAPRSASGAPAATSKPGVAQPFSSPSTPAPAAILSKPTKAAAPRVQSSCPAGTVLKGLNFYKDKQDPVAMADEEYPAWLWGVLDKGKGGVEAKGAGVDEGDLYGESFVFCFVFLMGFFEEGREGKGGFVGFLEAWD